MSPRETKPDASGSRRVSVTLSCSVCGARNYRTTKLRKEGSKPLELQKYCKTCGRHTRHQEGK